jgi:drug/metabolite transporter (DMT)-like permease
MYRGVLCALAAAGLFGASTPLAKALLGDVSPIVFAGLLYAGSGVGLGLVHLARVSMDGRESVLALPSGGQWVWLGAAIFFGGILGPVLLLLGLAMTAASTVSLLLSLESAFTALLAWFVFREHFDRRIASGMAAILAGGMILSLEPGQGARFSSGALLVVAACLCWAVDNNLTRRVSGSDAILIAGLKGIISGAVNLILALSLGYTVPGGALIWTAAAVGFVGYGLSLVLFVLGLRHLGAARTGAYFSIAPFFGAIVAVLLLGDAVTWRLCVATVLMAVGLWLHLSERHEHEHAHQPLEHTHLHSHDEHHQHVHAFPWNGGQPHTHPHVHAAIAHRHPHFPDLHHRHRHD